MNYKTLDKNSKTELTILFTSAFSSSEGKEEGELIGNLASALSSNIDNEEIICFGAYEENSIVGAIFFTRLGFGLPTRFICSPPLQLAPSAKEKASGRH